jgi:hypothetical protein
MGAISRLDVSVLLVADQRCLTGDALPTTILANPGIGKTAGLNLRLAFNFYPLVIVPGYKGGAAVEVDLHIRVAQLLVLIDSLFKVREPLRPVHEATVVVSVGKRLRDQHAHSIDIMKGLGLVPGVFEGENCSGFVLGEPVIFSSRSVLGVGSEAHQQ